MDRILTRLTWIFGFILLSSNVFSQDPNFYIFLCLGQSNMEGQAPVGAQDMSVDSRFRVMEALNCSNLGRNMGTWYTATPPLCRCYTGLSPVDYFGRKLVANLPSNIKVGVVMVAVAGCKIELFDKATYLTKTKYKELKVYPGISRDYINIKGISGICMIGIFSTTGRLLFEKILEADKTPVNVSTFPEGVYIVTLIGNDGKALNAKFIKLK